MVTTMKDMVAVLICEDVQDSIEFYTNVLGFTVVDRMDTVGKTGWASLNNGGVQLMLASPDYIPEPQKSEGRYSQASFRDPSEGICGDGSGVSILRNEGI